MDQKKISPAKSGTSKNREKKEQLVSKLSEKIGRAKGLVFTNYQGLTHKQLEELKKSLKGANAELVVTKNTLLKLALTAHGLQTTAVDGLSAGKAGSQTAESFLNNPTATIFEYEDVIAPLKHLAKTLKNLGLPTIKFGILDGQALDSEQLLKLSSLPGREVLLAQFVGALKSPIFGLHRALNWNLQKLVMTFEQIKNQKENIKNT